MRSILLICTLFAACISCNRYQNYDRCEVVDATYVHKYGAEVPQEDWQQRGGYGTVISKMQNGITVTQSYNAGQLDGETTYSFPHREGIEKREVYSQNVLQKDAVHYVSGTPMRETQYQPNGDKLITSWYENGSPQAKEEYSNAGTLVKGEYFDRNHQLDSSVESGNGTRTNRDSYGQILSRDTIQDGVLATRTMYYPNNAPKEVTSYKNGNIEGTRKTYYPEGDPNTVEEWLGGVQHGLTIEYKNGEKFAEVPYVRGVKEGREKRYANGNTLVEEISWHNNQKHGQTKIYVSGIEKTEWYFHGKPVTKGNFDAMSGPLAEVIY